jgi:lipoyl synthase
MSCVKTEGVQTDKNHLGLDINTPEIMQPRSFENAPKDLRNGGRVKGNDVAPTGVYLPNNNIQTPNMTSPEYVQLSTAAALTLGLMPGSMYNCSCTRCLNILLTYPEGCRANCAYCGLARHREAERDYADRNFIRVDWPSVPMNQVSEIVAKQIKEDGETPFHRMCISMITHPKSDKDTFTVLKNWTDHVSPDDVAISILSNPTTMVRDDLVRLRDMGTDIFTVAIDAATPEIFDRTRGKGVQSPHTFKKYWDTIIQAKDIYGDQKFGAHIIVGMGETEYEMLSLIQKLVDLGGHSHLFAFYPEAGSLMEHLPSTPRDQWRRVQLGRYLIDYAGLNVSQMKFDELGRVADFGMPKAELDMIIDTGLAFQTSGCPGKFAEDISACDRPYGDSPVSDIASYPFKPEGAHIRKIRQQLDMEKPGESYEPGEEFDEL